MTILLKLIYKFNVILIKVPAGCFAEIDKQIQKCIWKYKTSRRAKTVLEKKQTSCRTFSLKTIAKATVFKTVQ